MRFSCRVAFVLQQQAHIPTDLCFVLFASRPSPSPPSLGFLRPLGFRGLASLAHLALTLLSPGGVTSPVAGRAAVEMSSGARVVSWAHGRRASGHGAASCRAAAEQGVAAPPARTPPATRLCPRFGAPLSSSLRLLLELSFPPISPFFCELTFLSLFLSLTYSIIYIAPLLSLLSFFSAIFCFILSSLTILLPRLLYSFLFQYFSFLSPSRFLFPLHQNIFLTFLTSPFGIFYFLLAPMHARTYPYTYTVYRKKE